MVFQLPPGVDAEAVAVICYSFICLFSNFLLLWLLWTHNDRSSYIACISYATLVVTVTSICEQFYNYSSWMDIMTEQFYYAKENADNAEVQYHKGSRGVKLVLGYVRIFGFTISSTFVFFFALSLAASVYGWFATTPRATHTISIIGRVLPIILTSITVGLMLSPPAQKSFLVYMLVANAQFVLSLLGSAILLVMILSRYVHSRRTLSSWKVIYGNADPSQPSSSDDGGSKARSIWLGSGGSSRGGQSEAYSGAGANKTYDSWLVMRLSIAFVVLCVFEYTNIVPRIEAANHTVNAAARLQPDLSTRRARSSVRGYLPGVTPSLVAFLVFGTTKTFQRKIYETFVPEWFRRRRRQKGDLSVSSGNASAPSPPQPPSRPARPADEFSLADLSPRFFQNGSFSPRFAPDGNLSPRFPHGSQSNPAPRFPPHHSHTPSAGHLGPGLAALGPQAMGPGVSPSLHSKFSVYGRPDARDMEPPKTLYD